MMSDQLTFEMLDEQLPGLIVLSPINGKPQLIKSENKVWQAIDKLGGCFNIDHFFIEVTAERAAQWIVDQVVPLIYALEIADILRMDLKDLVKPSVGFYDKNLDVYWPIDWSPDSE